MIFFSKKQIKNNKLIENIQQFSKVLSSSTQLKDLLKNALVSLYELSQASTARVLLLEQDAKSFAVRESLGGAPLVSNFSSRDSFINYLAQTRRPLLRSELLASEHLVDIKEAGIRFLSSVGGDAVFPMEVEGRCIGFLVLGRCHFQQNDGSDMPILLEILTDMTALAVHSLRLNETLSRQNLKLSEVADLKTQFISTVTHELSTPLNGIVGMTQVLLDPEAGGELSSDQRRYVEMIQSAGEELSEHVHQILDLTRLQNQSGSLEVKRLELGKILQEVEQDLTLSFEDKSIVLQKDLTKFDVAYGDPGQIRQVFHSLLENALKFSRSNEGESMIGVSVQKEGEWLKVCVQDQGMGISEELQSIIFEEFRQGDSGTTRTHGGTGVGLALVKRIVELHGGRIWVESKANYGSQFFFTLPRKPGLVRAQEI